MLKVSVIVPVFNSEKFLNKCIDSLINQTIDNYEIILVNDASTDNSLDILLDYEKKNSSLIKVINSNVNLRQGGARNLGIKSALGEYIGFVDSDDWVKPEMFDKLYSKAKSADYDVVGCNYIIKSNSSETVVNQYNSWEWTETKPLSVDKKRRLLASNGNVCSRIYKKTLLIENNLYFPEHLAYEDNYFIPIVDFFTNTFGVVCDPLYYYFKQNPESTTTKRNTPYQLDRVNTANMLYDWFNVHDIKKLYKTEIEYLYTKYLYVGMTDVLITKFDVIDMDLLRDIQEEFLGKYPFYYKNKYYINRYKRTKRLMIRLNDKFIPGYIFVYKLKSKLKNRH